MDAQRQPAARGLVVVLAGPSGVGKSSIAHKLIERHPHDYVFSVSATTRPPRPGEVDSSDYFFLTPQTFQRWIDEGRLLEWAEYNERRYGTPLPFVEAQLAQGHVVLLDIELQGLKQIVEQEKVPVLSVFVMPPSLEVLAERLRNRRTDAEPEVARRLGIAQHEMRLGPMLAEYPVVNHDLNEATDEVEALIEARRDEAAEAQGELP